VQLYAAATHVAALVTAGQAEQLPVLPHTGELIFGFIAIAILYVIVKKKVVPNLEKAYADRVAAIEGGMHKAEEAQQQAEAALEQYKAQLAEARHEAARLRQEAQEQGATLITEMRAEGQRQREEIVAAGHSQIEADRKAAASALRQDVGKLATELAGKLVGESLEDHARQSRVIDRFLDELEEKAEASR